MGDDKPDSKGFSWSTAAEALPSGYLPQRTNMTIMVVMINRRIP
jgi:hypothetical protein